MDGDLLPYADLQTIRAELERIEREHEAALRTAAAAWNAPERDGQPEPTPEVRGAPLAPEALPICSPTHPLAHEGPIVFLKYLRISPLDPMLEDALVNS